MPSSTCEFAFVAYTGWGGQLHTEIMKAKKKKEKKKEGGGEKSESESEREREREEEEEKRVGE